MLRWKPVELVKRRVLAGEGAIIFAQIYHGKTADIFASSMTFLPIWLRNFLAGIMVKIATGPNSWYGLPKVNHKFGATHPTVNSELLYMIRHGKVKPKPDIEKRMR